MGGPDIKVGGGVVGITNFLLEVTYELSPELSERPWMVWEEATACAKGLW